RRVKSLESVVEFLLSNQDMVGRHVRLVELARIVRECLVAIGFDSSNDRPDLVQVRADILVRSLHEGRARRRRHGGKLIEIAGFGHEFFPHLDLRKMSSPTIRSSATITKAATATNTTEIAARSGVMMERLEL